MHLSIFFPRRWLEGLDHKEVRVFESQGYSGTLVAPGSVFPAVWFGVDSVCSQGTAAASQIRPRTHLMHTVDNSWVIVF